MNFRFNVVQWPPNSTFQDVATHLADYWVQITGLTREKMNNKNALLIGTEIGEVIELEDTSKIDVILRGFIRVKVRIDTVKPFPTGFWLPLNEYTNTRVEYGYEGLCDFCYRCGRLGHHMDVCKNFRILEHDEEQPENIWYESWMKRSVTTSLPIPYDRSARVHRKKNKFKVDHGFSVLTSCEL